MEINIKEDDKVKQVISKHYNFIFNKETGFFARWGETKDIDPIMAPAPEILDLEISSGGECLGNCPFCSPADTYIEIPNGKIKIQNLKIGDKVFSYNEKTKSKEINIIKKTYSHTYSGEIIEINLENGAILRLTPEHKVYILNIGWIEASEITDDMEILNVKEL